MFITSLPVPTGDIEIAKLMNMRKSRGVPQCPIAGDVNAVSKTLSPSFADNSVFKVEVSYIETKLYTVVTDVIGSSTFTRSQLLYSKAVSNFYDYFYDYFYESPCSLDQKAARI